MNYSSNTYSTKKNFMISYSLWNKGLYLYKKKSGLQ